MPLLVAGGKTKLQIIILLSFYYRFWLIFRGSPDKPAASFFFGWIAKIAESRPNAYITPSKLLFLSPGNGERSK